jgi:hypothetical protein
LLLLLLLLRLLCCSCGGRVLHCRRRCLWAAWRCLRVAWHRLHRCACPGRPALLLLLLLLPGWGDRRPASSKWRAMAGSCLALLHLCKQLQFQLGHQSIVLLIILVSASKAATVAGRGPSSCSCRGCLQGCCRCWLRCLSCRRALGSTAAQAPWRRHELLAAGGPHRSRGGATGTCSCRPLLAAPHCSFHAASGILLVAGNTDIYLLINNSSSGLLCVRALLRAAPAVHNAFHLIQQVQQRPPLLPRRVPLLATAARMATAGGGGNSPAAPTLAGGVCKAELD